MQPRKERKPPPETNMANILERARKSCLALPDDLVWPEPEPGRNLVIEDVSLGEDREDEERVSHMLIESDNAFAACQPSQQLVFIAAINYLNRQSP